MAKSKESFNKKEKEKKRMQDRKEKEERKQQRKADADAQKGQGIDHMMAYVDENGNLSSTPPDPRNKIEINTEDIMISIPRLEEREAEDRTRKGIIINFNNDKGYGFIRDMKTNESFFVHIKSILEPVQERDKVSFLTERGQKGMVAVEVKKIV